MIDRYKPKFRNSVYIIMPSFIQLSTIQQTHWNIIIAKQNVSEYNEWQN